MIIDTVKSLKYEMDLAKFLDSLVLASAIAPLSHNQTQQMKIVLAVLDQKTGLQPQSSDSFYLMTYALSSQL